MALDIKLSSVHGSQIIGKPITTPLSGLSGD